MSSGKRKPSDDVGASPTRIKKQRADGDEQKLDHPSAPTEPRLRDAHGKTTIANRDEFSNSTYINKLEKRIVKLEHFAASFTDRCDELNNSIQSFISQKESLQGMLKNAQKVIGRLEGNIQQFADLEATGDVVKERDQLRCELESAQRQLSQLTEDLQQIAGVQHSAPDLDSVLEDQFLGLRHEITSFTLHWCDRQISTSSNYVDLPFHVKTALAAVSGIPATRLLGSGLHARYFVQALIWRQLCDMFLTNPFLVWGKDDTVGNFARRVQNSSKLPANRLQFWRTVTGRVLFDISTPRTCRVARWGRNLAERVGPLVKAEYSKDIVRHIDLILDKAVKIAMNLCQSRTLCVIQRKSPDADDSTSQEYNDTWMEIVEKSLVSYRDIDFLVAPALIQLTNSVGDPFKRPRVLVKAQVCFGRDGFVASVPPAVDSSRNQNKIKITGSGRKSVGVTRLGDAADDAGLNEVLGDDVDEDNDSGSGDYENED